MKDLEPIALLIQKDIEHNLNKSGVLSRIFYRVKSEKSLKDKLSSKAHIYKKDNTKMQDIIGIRITLYFSDDVGVVYDYLKNKPNYLDESIDSKSSSSFKPERLNLIMRLENEDLSSIVSNYGIDPELIDATYEIQIRTVLSEGWHEVEHDLRYKCKDDWEQMEQYSRVLNGIYATLETGDWAMLNLFNEMAYEYYRKQKWNAMLRNKMRVRFFDNSLSESILSVINNNNLLAKQALKVDRKKLMSLFFSEDFRLPLTYDTIFHIINRIEMKDVSLIELESPVLKKQLDILCK